ncbi:FecR domain-containing protein [Parabacteroides sp.]|uniref:FecR family protein n=1 Tax=Parabacteroides sp. TaxID=1869337 RepID=UPI003080EE65
MNNIKIKLLDRFMRGETSPEDEQLLFAWFWEENAQEDILTFYRDRWLQAKEEDLSEETQVRMLNQIKLQIENNKNEIKGNRKERLLSGRLMLRRWIPYAVAIILCIVVGLTTHLYTLNKLPLNNEYVVKADKGQRASMTLPDGTKVWLNSHTQIFYNGDYGINDRSVKLIGEAYFEVAKDKGHRFIVKTDGLDVEALGTSFNIKAYQDDNEVIATLFTGSIRATAKEHSVILSPDQQVCFDRNSKALKVENPENATYASMWRNNELAFNGETLYDIAVRLNRLYDIQIEFKSEKIKNYRFSGVIKNNSLDNIFEIISLTSPIQYEYLGDTIMLSEKQ